MKPAAEMVKSSSSLVNIRLELQAHGTLSERNRIIAGLVQTLLVTEARHQGGVSSPQIGPAGKSNVLAIPGMLPDYFQPVCNNSLRQVQSQFKRRWHLEEFRF